jgi:hypothetical protein
MKIVLIRHLKVIIKRRFFVTGAQFEHGLMLYDASEISKTEFKIKPEDFPVCYASSKKRAVETAKLIYAGAVVVSDDLIEVKSASSFLKRIHIPGFMRAITARILWYFNYPKLPEIRKHSIARARRFVDTVLDGSDQDTLIVTHGFFMHSLKMVLREKGFRGKIPVFPKNGHPYVFERKGN